MNVQEIQKTIIVQEIQETNLETLEMKIVDQIEKDANSFIFPLKATTYVAFLMHKRMFFIFLFKFFGC